MTEILYDPIITENNSFFGTYDHYQRIGWYFDKVVENLGDLSNCLSVMTGRFVLVTSEDAIFLRTSVGTEDPNIYYKYTTTQIDSETGRVYFDSSVEEIEISSGFRFIGYLTPHAKLLLDKDGSFFDFDAEHFTIPYKIANDDCVKRISAYYFPTVNNNIWEQEEELLSEEVEVFE